MESRPDCEIIRIDLESAVNGRRLKETATTFDVDVAVAVAVAAAEVVGAVCFVLKINDRPKYDSDIKNKERLSSMN